ncbi:MAG: class I SAM-dependent methyltransferase [Pseudomonadota bacterium]
MPRSASPAYTPPLGYRALTPLYDAAIALMTREKRWRSRLVAQIDPQPGDRILDIGCGTGSLAVALQAACPGAEIVGLDPDGEALNRARAKLPESTRIRFIEGFFGEAELPWTPTKIVSSLVFHQVPLATKADMFNAIARALPPGGQFHLADYSRQDTAMMRVAFRATVQLLDGREDTQPNADGALESLMQDSGLYAERTYRLATPTGAISIYLARIGDRATASVRDEPETFEGR